MGFSKWTKFSGMVNKRARVPLTLRLICGYLLRSLLPFLTFILWNITGRLNVQLIYGCRIKYLLLYSCVLPGSDLA